MIAVAQKQRLKRSSSSVKSAGVSCVETVTHLIRKNTKKTGGKKRMNEEESVDKKISRMCDEMMEELKKKEKIAKKKDTLVGRFFYVSVGDGKAFYQITDIDEDQVEITHFDHPMNEYQAPYFQKGKWIDKDWVEERLQAEKNMKELFS